MLQEYIRNKVSKEKDAYYNLTEVLRFERLCKECIMEMFHVCDAQLSFWGHLQLSSKVDFNTLDKTGDRLQKHARNIERLWGKIVGINPAHLKARTRYASYLIEIRNDLERGREVMDGYRTLAPGNLQDAARECNDVLFDERTVIVHVSGCKADLGRVLRISSAVAATFGFSPTDLCNSSVSKLMPSVVGRSHNRLMENYLKTGKSKIFNKERFLYGQHKDGHCFKVKVLVKTMPKLDSGITRFVGMIVKVVDDFEYVLTDTRGVISAMTAPLAELLGIEHRWLHRSPGLNIQLLAPDLIRVFNKQGSECKFKEEGGDELQIVVPEGLCSYLESQEPGKSHSESRLLFKESLAKYNHLLGDRKKAKDSAVVAEDLWSTESYRNSSFLTKTKCQLQQLKFILTESRVCVAVGGNVVEFVVARLSGLKFNKANESYDEDEKTMSFSAVEIYNKEKEVISDFEDEEAANRWKNKKFHVAELMTKVFKGSNLKPLDGEQQGEYLDSGETGTKRFMSDTASRSPRDSLGSGNDSAGANSSDGAPPEESKLRESKKASLDNVIVEVKESSEENSDDEEENLIKSSKSRLGSQKLGTRRKSKFYKGHNPFGLEKEEFKHGKGSIELGKGSVEGERLRKAKTIKAKRTEIAPLIKRPHKPAEVDAEDIINDEGKSEDVTSYVSNWNLASHVLSSNRSRKDSIRKLEPGLIEPKQIDEEQLNFSYSSHSEDLHANKSDDDSIALIFTKKNTQKIGSDNSSVLPSLANEERKQKQLRSERYKPMASVNKLEDMKHALGEDAGVYLRSKTNEMSTKLVQDYDNVSLKPKTPLRRVEGILRSGHFEKKLSRKVNLVNDPRYGDPVPVPEDSRSEGEVALREYFHERQIKKKKEENKLVSSNAKTDEASENSKKEESEKESTEDTYTNSTLRPLYSVRAAVEEEFAPGMYKCLSIAFMVCLVVVIVTAVVYYVFERRLYVNMKNNLRTVSHTELRSCLLMDINIHLKTRLAMNKYLASDIVETQAIVSREEARELYQTSYEHISNSSIDLKNAQTFLSVEAKYLNAEQKLAVNPKNIDLRYKTSTPKLQESYPRSLSQSIIGVTTACLRILNFASDDLDENNFSVYMVTENSLNRLLNTMKKSTTDLLDHLYKYKDDTVKVFLILTIIDAAFLLAAKILSVRMALSIKQNKNEVFSLFLHLTKVEVQKCQAKCEQFKRLNKMVICRRTS